MLKYIELKSGYNNDGPAWIGHVTTSKSGRTIYFNGKGFKRAPGGAGPGNYFELGSGDIYWISGIKRDGQNRHWAGSGKITIEATAVEEYLHTIGGDSLDRSRFVVSNDIKPTTTTALHEEENEQL